MESFSVRFARHLRALREEHGLTQAALAERAGLSSNAISSYERAIRFPEGPSMDALAKVFGIEPMLALFSVREAPPPAYDAGPAAASARRELERLLSDQPEGVVRLVAEIARVVVQRLPAIG